MPLIMKEIYALNLQSPYSLPIGIEYEKLYDWLNDRRDKKYNIVDARSRVATEFKTLSPGTYDKQSLINFDEPYTKAVYPISDIPYSQGVSWE